MKNCTFVHLKGTKRRRPSREHFSHDHYQQEHTSRERNPRPHFTCQTRAELPCWGSRSTLVMISKQLAIKEAHHQPQQITLYVSKIDHPFLLHPSTTTVLRYLIEDASEHEEQLLEGPFRLTTEHPEPTIPEDSTCLSGSSIAPLHPSSSPSSSSGKFHSAINSSSAQPKCTSLDLLLNANSVIPSPPVAVTSENFLHNNRTNIPILGIYPNPGWKTI